MIFSDKFPSFNSSEKPKVNFVEWTNSAAKATLSILNWSAWNWFNARIRPKVTDIPVVTKKAKVKTWKQAFLAAGNGELSWDKL